MQDQLGQTTSWDIIGENKNLRDAKQILALVYQALKEKGYNPMTQLSGFISTGDPTYITSYNQARSMICRLEREDIIEEIVSVYLEKLDNENR